MALAMLTIAGCSGDEAKVDLQNHEYCEETVFIDRDLEYPMHDGKEILSWNSDNYDHEMRYRYVCDDGSPPRKQLLDKLDNYIIKLNYSQLERLVGGGANYGYWEPIHDTIYVDTFYDTLIMYDDSKTQTVEFNTLVAEGCPTNQFTQTIKNYELKDKETSTYYETEKDYDSSWNSYDRKVEHLKKTLTYKLTNKETVTGDFIAE